MSTLINLMIKIILLVSLGWGLKKAGVINDELQKGISSLLMTAVLPLNILASSCQELTKEYINGTVLTVIFSVIYYVGTIVIMTILSKPMHVNEKQKKLIITMSVFANTGFIGFPLVEEMFGSSCMIYAVIYNLFYNLFFYTYGVYLLSNDGKANVKMVLKTPVTVSSFLAVVIFWGQIPLPEVVISTFSTVGAMTVPLSMIIIGCTLADMRLIEVLKDKQAYLVSALRLVVFPAVAFVVFKLLGVSGNVAGICVLITALPSGSLNVIVAQQQDCEPEFAGRAVVQSMVFMVVTLVGVFWGIQRL